VFVSRFKKAVKKATHQVRKEQSEIVAVVQQALESMQAVKAFGRQDLEQEELRDVSHARLTRHSKHVASRRCFHLSSPSRLRCVQPWSFGEART
jgi:ABC-type multidrug transport system fused ATPase/permease subunit